MTVPQPNPEGTDKEDQISWKKQKKTVIFLSGLKKHYSYNYYQNSHLIIIFIIIIIFILKDLPLF